MLTARYLRSAVDFFNQLNMLVSRLKSERVSMRTLTETLDYQYGCITEFCTPQECPTMSAGPRFEYHWQDGVRYRRPTKMSAPGQSIHLPLRSRRCCRAFLLPATDVLIEGIPCLQSMSITS